MTMNGKFVVWLLLLLSPACSSRAQTVSQLAAEYLAGYQRLHIPEQGFDYQQNLRQIPATAQLKR